jgi:serine/threonine protein kinase
MTSNLIGTVLEGYQLVEVIGSSALATVYKAQQPAIARWVAVKVLRYAAPETLDLFKQEAPAIARLRHGNIVIVYKYGEADSRPYLVMEYVEGGTLTDRLIGKPMNWVKVTHLSAAIAEALEYAHSRGMIHTDLRPSNILMPQEDWPLLADFGLAGLAELELAKSDVGLTIRPPAYLSPEQARAETVDHRTDIYSLGVVMFEMVTGRRPFDYADPDKVLGAHASEPTPSPRDLNPNCPVWLEQVILKAMQKSPADRYDTVAQMVQALKEVLASSDERPTFYTPPTASSLRTLIHSTFSKEKLKRSVEHGTKELGSEALPSPLSGTKIFLREHDITLDVPDKDSLVIGRSHRTNIVDIDLGPYGAAKSGLSRRHARLIKQADQWWLEDLESLNGTFVNEVKLEPGHPVRLKDGDFIRCSYMSLIFLTSSGQESSG